MHRLLLLVLLIAPFSPVLAQEPDSVDAHRYLPLDVGSHWQYELYEDECFNGHGCQTVFRGRLDRRVVGDSLVGELQYQVIRDMRFNAAGQQQTTIVRLVRFDSTEARAYVEHGGPWPDHLFEFECPLDLPEGVHTCGSSEMWKQSFVSTGFPTWGGVGGIGTIQSPYKSFGGLICYVVFVADLGMLRSSCVHPGGPWDTLSFASVHGIEYGTFYPVSDESPAWSVDAGLQVYPNPALGSVVARITLHEAQVVTISIFDLLGRRVLERELGPLAGGEHEARLDSGSLPAGLYIVRLTGDAGARAVVRLSRM